MGLEALDGKDIMFLIDYAVKKKRDFSLEVRNDGSYNIGFTIPTKAHTTYEYSPITEE